MTIIGIDPGTATTGFSILKKENGKIKLLDYGCITTAPHQPLPDRLEQITDNLETLLIQWSPNTAAIEELFFSKNIKTAMSVAQARGAILNQLNKKNIQIAEYNPLEIKNGICGNGRAKKKEIQKMVQLIFNLKKPPQPDDAADAIAIAYCHASNSLKHLTKTN